MRIEYLARKIEWRGMCINGPSFLKKQTEMIHGFGKGITWKGYCLPKNRAVINGQSFLAKLNRTDFPSDTFQIFCRACVLWKWYN